MRRLWRTATFRLALIFALVFALGSGALLLALEDSVVRFAEQTLKDALRDQMAVMQADVEKEGIEALAEIMEHERSGEAASHLYYRIVSPTGLTFAGGLPPEAVTTRGYGRMTVPDPRNAASTVSVMTLTVHLPNGSHLAVARDTRALEILQARVRALELWGSVGLVALALIGGLGAGFLFIRRLDAVNAAAARIVGGDVGERLPAIGFGREFDDLSANLNRMLDRLATTMTALRQVSSDVAHDLRTPLTRLRNTLDEAADANAEDREAHIAAALAETDEILATFAALLRISQIEGGDARRGFALINLSTVAARTIEAYRPSVEDAGRRLILVAPDDAPVTGDEAMLAQMLANLVENALLHAVGATEIHVMVERRAGATHLMVADDGPGVPAAALGRLGQRFFRVDPSRHAPGAGLGLALAAATAAVHEARLRFDNGDPGLIVELAFPPAK